VKHCFDSPEVRHGYVENDHVKGDFVQKSQGLETVRRRRRDDPQMTRPPKDFLQSIPE
jgi:hypothetical protein